MLKMKFDEIRKTPLGTFVGFVLVCGIIGVTVLSGGVALAYILGAFLIGFMILLIMLIARAIWGLIYGFWYCVIHGFIRAWEFLGKIPTFFKRLFTKRRREEPMLMK